VICFAGSGSFLRFLPLFSGFFSVQLGFHFAMGDADYPTREILTIVVLVCFFHVQSAGVYLPSEIFVARVFRKRSTWPMSAIDSSLSIATWDLRTCAMCRRHPSLNARISTSERL